MKCLSIMNILLIAAFTTSTIALPLSAVENSQPQTKSTLETDQVETSNERQGRSWTPFGDASSSRRGRFNRDIESNSAESTKMEESKIEIPQSQAMKPNERQGRSWSPFGDAVSSRRGRFNREITETEQPQAQQQAVPAELETPQKSSETSQLKPEQNERQGRSWSPFGDASASRRGRFNRDIESKSAESTKTEESKTDISQSQSMKSNERQGRAWSPFGDAVSSRRGRFN